MNEWTFLVNLSIDAAAVMITIFALGLTVVSRHIERPIRHFFLLFFSVLMLYVLSNLAWLITEQYPAGARYSQLAIFFESLFSSLLMPMLTMYLLKCCRERKRGNPVFIITMVLWTCYFVLLVITQFTRGIYYISEDNVYHRGPWYPLLLVPPVLIMVVNLIAVLRRRSKLSSRQFYAFLIYFFMPMAGMVFQMLFYGIFVIVLATSIAAAILLLIILTDQVETIIRQREENAHLEASALVLQMRPHFIYNTMMSIYYLIRQDQDKAQQVTLDFITYLRKNFVAIAREGTIPFTEELEHTRAYLEVEKVRFEGLLYTEIDTPHTLFHLPPLTLQPIVENAVKHGVDPDREPLYLSIITRKADSFHEIVVIDTGPGFQPGAGKEPHDALSNIQKRLDMICGGSLLITGRKEGGTKVTIRIPDAESKTRRYNNENHNL